MIAEITRFLNKLGFFEAVFKILPSNWIITITVHDMKSTSSLRNSLKEGSLVDKTSVGALEKVLKYASRFCSIMALEEALMLLANGRNIPKCVVSITFDDGYASQVKYGLPLLLDYNVKATFYILFEYVEKRKLFWWDELYYIFSYVRGGKQKSYSSTLPISGNKISDAINYLKALPRRKREASLEEVRKNVDIEIPKHAVGSIVMRPSDIYLLISKGMFIGGHSLSHPSLPGIPVEEALAEIRYSISKVRKYSRRQCIYTFAYPFGEHNAKIANAVRKLGFKAAVTTVPKASILRRKELFSLGRIQIAETDLDQLTAFKYMATNIYYNYRKVKTKLHRE